MNRNLIIVLAGGLLIAVLVALIVQTSLSGKKKNAPVKEEARVEIIVAVKPLPTGTKLDDKNVKWVPWPKSAVFPGAIVREGDKKPQEAAAGRLRRAVAEGEPVTKTALVGEGAGNFMAASLREGMVAITMDVSAVRGVAGFIAPGDYVDVILTYKKKVSFKDMDDDPQVDNMIKLNLDNRAAETILQNVHILAVDQSSTRNEEKIKVGKTVTLELSRRDAEVLIMARHIGDLTLVLRRLGDDKQYVRNYEIVTDERVTNITDDIYNQVLKIQNSGEAADIVRIYNGASLSQVSVSGQ